MTADLLQSARAAFGSGDYETATALAERILGERKYDRDALLLLSEIAYSTGQLDACTEYVRRAIKGNPRDPGLYLRLAQYHLLRARFPMAHNAVDKALKLVPDWPAGLAVKANIYERQDKYAKARAALAPVCRPNQPLDPVAAATYIRVLIHDEVHEEAAALARRLMAADLPADNGTRNAYFAALKAFERVGDYDAAFACAERANAIERFPHDPDTFRTLVDDYCRTFSAEWLASAPRATTVSELPVFVVGMPRCGSTLTERILDAHPDAFGADEIPALHRIRVDLPGALGTSLPYPGCVRELTTEVAEELGARYLAELRRYHAKAQRISNKDLGNFRQLGLIQLLLPGARIIHCRRDPVDTCLSCYTERLRQSSNPFSTDLEHLGLYYREYERLMAHWRDVLDVPMLEVDYEDLIASQEPVTRRIIEFLGLPWDDRCLRFHESKRQDKTLSYDQVRRPLYASSVGRAAAWGDRLDPLRRALSGVAAS